jgi:hypothetical protein
MNMLFDGYADHEMRAAPDGRLDLQRALHTLCPGAHARDPITARRHEVYAAAIVNQFSA